MLTNNYQEILANAQKRAIAEKCQYYIMQKDGREWFGRTKYDYAPAYKNWFIKALVLSDGTVKDEVLGNA